MEYNAPYGKERLSGRCFFTPTATTTVIDLGNVELYKIDFGIKKKEHFSCRHGVQVMDRYDAYASMAVWTVTLDEFASPLLSYAWAGTTNPNFVQAAGTAATFNFTYATSMAGTMLDIGKYGLFNASLTTPSSKVEGYANDYVLDRGAGKLYFPATTTIPAGAGVVTYSCPAITYDSVTALQILNRPGNLEVQGEDDSQAGKSTTGVDAVPPPRYVFTLPCVLSSDSSGEFKQDDYRRITMTATATAAMTVKRLQL